jgi:serine protease AprX
MLKGRTFVIASIVFFLGIEVFSPALSFAQSKYWIEFADKGISNKTFVPGNPIFEKTKASLSRRCLQRRALALHEEEISTITIGDAPICPRYLRSLRANGIKPLAESKWSNAVSAMLTPRQAKRLLKLPFVRCISPVGHADLVSTQPMTIPARLRCAVARMNPQSIDSGCGYDPIIYHYGDTNIGSNNRAEIYRLNVWPLHAMGFDGSGVLYGFLDDGMRWTTTSSIEHCKVLSQHNYVDDTDVLYDVPGDSVYQDWHGTTTLSSAMGYLPDTLIGPAYNATVMLAETENAGSERNVEEDNYANALEDMEARGVEITSSSLGYFTFDSGQHSYSYKDMNGHTAICTQAVDSAVKRGVLVVTAMGNGGDKPYPYVQAPGDADSILACGALDVNDSIAGFSSRGPTSDGRMKPDICAPGVEVWVQNHDGSFSGGTGTSYATPLTSSSCVLIKQAHPEATAQQIRHAVMITAANAAHPDTAYGWGEINAYAAALELGTIVHPMQASSDSVVARICAGIASKYHLKNVYLTYFGNRDTTTRTAPFDLVADSLIYSCSVGNAGSPITKIGTTMYFKISALDSSGVTTLNPRSGWDMLTLPGTSGVADNPQNAITSKLDVFPNPCSSELEFDSNVPGEWQLVNSNGSSVMTGTSRGAATVHIGTSQIVNGAYYLQFISTSGEAKTASVVVHH